MRKVPHHHTGLGLNTCDCMHPLLSFHSNYLIYVREFSVTYNLSQEVDGSVYKIAVLSMQSKRQT